MIYTLKGENYRLEINVEKNKTEFSSGFFGEISIISGEIFTLTAKDVLSGESIIINSLSFEKVCANKNENLIEILFENASELPEISVKVSGKNDKDGICWFVSVQNCSSKFSVMNITYPVPKIKSDYFNLFEPGTCGKVVKNAGVNGYKKQGVYPHATTCMQYFAFYGKNNGIYLGVHDGSAAVKKIELYTGENTGCIDIFFHGINALSAENSFDVYGFIRWEYFSGDWYDATMIYKDFVLEDATWLPKEGRPDTPDKFKNIAYWICDYIPNTKEQGDNTPKSFEIKDENINKDFWYTDAVRLQKELDCSMAYHIYNWHSIPFNVEYPHFLPAKAGFSEGIKAIKENSNILIFPYTNAVSWDMDDTDGGYSINFKNTGIYGTVKDENQEIKYVEYPQKTKSGKEIRLAPMCPSYEKWHKIIGDLISEIEDKYDVDGIYLDEVSAHPVQVCYNKTHSHLPGGGSYWVEKYNEMMEKINKNKNGEKFYYSECNAEPFIKGFDGFLTWTWVQNGEVPAFPTIYSRYVEMVGRYAMGNKEDDFLYFKNAVARSLLFGQQIGWFKLNVLYKEKWLPYLKKAVKLREKYIHVFKNSIMMRPAEIKTDLKSEYCTPALHFKENIEVEPLIFSGWKDVESGKVTMFLANVLDFDGKYSLYINNDEYKISEKNLTEGFSFNGNNIEVKGEISGQNFIIWEI